MHLKLSGDRTTRSNMRAALVLMSLVLSTQTSAAALSTTSIGFAQRTVKFVPEKTSANNAEDNATIEDEDFSDPIICQRVSTPIGLDLELGAGGCMQSGGIWTLARSVSTHVHLLYYPFTTKSRIENDSAISLDQTVLGDLYIMGTGGLTKITHGQTAITKLSFSMDALEVGASVGWTYRLFDFVSLGIEGTYLIGSVLSTAGTGSTSVAYGTSTITVFL